MTPGIQEWTDAEYFESTAVSRGDVKRVEESSAVYRSHATGELTDEESSAMLLGRLAHMAVLEPVRFAKEVAIKPPSNKVRVNGLDDDGWFVSKGGVRTMGRERTKLWEQAYADRTIATVEHYALATNIANAVHSHPGAAPLIGSVTEVPIAWQDEVTGMWCKAKIDALPAERVPVDLKNCIDPSPDGFMRATIRDRLHLQDAHYRMGLAAIHSVDVDDIAPMTFIAVRHQPPHEVALYVLDYDVRQLGIETVRAALDTIHARSQSGDWRNPWEATHDGQPNVIEWPPYALKPTIETPNV